MPVMTLKSKKKSQKPSGISIEHLMQQISEEPDAFKKGKLLNALGIQLTQKEHYQDALETLQNAVKSFETAELSAENEIAMVFNNIGLLFLHLEDNGKALQYFSQSLAEKQKAGILQDSTYATTLSNIGLIHYYKREVSRADEYCRKAIEIYEINHDYNLPYAGVLIMQGALKVELSEFEEALVLFHRALPIYEKLNHRSGILDVYINIGWARFQQGKILESLSAFNMALDLIDETEDSFHLRRIYDQMSKIYESESDFEAALKYRNLERDLHTRIINEDLKKRIADTDIKFELTAKSRELENWKNQNKGLREIKKQLELEITHRSDIEKVLRDQNYELQKVKQAVEHSASTVVITDQEGAIEYVNPKFVEMTGYTCEEAIGQNPRILKSDLQDDGFYKDMWETISSGKPWTGEFHNIRKNGEPFWEQASISPVIDETGKITHYIAVKEDITELKEYKNQLEESLNEKETLLREIHHRIKNNLAIVSSLLSLQSMEIEDESIRKMCQQSQNRIKVIATIHEKLYRSVNFKHINFKDYIESLVNDISEMYANIFVQIDVSVSNIFGVAETATSCGLIINELLTNALKYAFPRGKSNGKITVSMNQRDDSIELIVSDNGVGLPEDFDIEQSHTLGLQLVNSLIEKIDGTLKIVSENGTTFQINFKLPE